MSCGFFHVWSSSFGGPDGRAARPCRFALRFPVFQPVRAAASFGSEARSFSDRTGRSNMQESATAAARRVRAKSATPTPRVRLYVPDDQVVHLTEGQGLPVWPAGATAPRQGDVIYVSSTSAWGVALVVHEFQDDGSIAVQVWLEWVGAARTLSDGDSRYVH